MSVRKRGDKWIAEAYDPQKGRKAHVGTYPTRGEARDAEQKAQQRFRRTGGRETVRSFAERWMADYPRRKDSTNLYYAQQIRALVRDFGDRPLGDVQRVEARRWSLEHRANWPAARAMFSDAVRDDLCEQNPFRGMRLAESRGRRDLVVPTEVEVDRLVELAAVVHGSYGERVYGNLIRFAAYTGLRPGELYGLEWGDLDFDGDTVRVERQWNAKVGKATTPKNGLARTVYLTPPARAAVLALPEQKDYVFLTPRGTRFSQRVSHYYWNPVRCAFGRPDLDFYALRHFYGTFLANLGVGAPEIAQALGHTDGGKLALARYIHVAEQDARAKIARAFNADPIRPVGSGADGQALRRVSGAGRGDDGA